MRMIVFRFQISFLAFSVDSFNEIRCERCEIMKSIKEWLNKINSNPVLILLVNLIAFLDLLVLLFGDIVGKIVGGVVVCAIIIVILQRYFSYKEIKSRTIIDLCEHINSYNEHYKECFEQINNGTIINKEQLDSKLAQLTNCIQTISSSILNCTTCICVKLIDAQKITDLDYKKWHLYTIARSNSTKSKRRQNDANPDIVEENTDFCSILDRNASASQYNNYADGFISYDLDRTKQEMRRCGCEYRNSHFDFEYKSTIVYPIQFNSNLFPLHIIDKMFKEKPCNQMFIAGFLCLDTEEKFKDNDKTFEKAGTLLWHYCQSLSVLLWNYSVMRLNLFEDVEVSVDEKQTKTSY